MSKLNASGIGPLSGDGPGVVDDIGELQLIQRRDRGDDKGEGGQL
jgi:hypothetical protein